MLLTLSLKIEKREEGASSISRVFHFFSFSPTTIVTTDTASRFFMGVAAGDIRIYGENFFLALLGVKAIARGANDTQPANVRKWLLRNLSNAIFSTVEKMLSTGHSMLGLNFLVSRQVRPLWNDYDNRFWKEPMIRGRNLL